MCILPQPSPERPLDSHARPAAKRRRLEEASERATAVAKHAQRVQRCEVASAWCSLLACLCYRPASYTVCLNVLSAFG